MSERSQDSASRPLTSADRDSSIDSDDEAGEEDVLSFAPRSALDDREESRLAADGTHAHSGSVLGLHNLAVVIPQFIVTAISSVSELPIRFGPCSHVCLKHTLTALSTLYGISLCPDGASQTDRTSIERQCPRRAPTGCSRNRFPDRRCICFCGRSVGDPLCPPIRTLAYRIANEYCEHRTHQLCARHGLLQFRRLDSLR